MNLILKCQMHQSDFNVFFGWDFLVDYLKAIQFRLISLLPNSKIIHISKLFNFLSYLRLRSKIKNRIKAKPPTRFQSKYTKHSSNFPDENTTNGFKNENLKFKFVKRINLKCCLLKNEIIYFLILDS